jgi:hypothetical protein
VLVTLGVIGENPYYGAFNRRHSTCWSGFKSTIVGSNYRFVEGVLPAL